MIYRQRLTDGPGRVLAARAARSLAVGGRAELSSVVERCYLSLVQSARVHEEHMWQARRMANIHHRRMPPYRRGVQHALPVFFTSVRVRSRPGRLHLSLFNNMVEKKENRDKYSNKKKAHLSTPAWTTVSDAKVKQQNYNDYTNSSNSK